MYTSMILNKKFHQFIIDIEFETKDNITKIRVKTIHGRSEVGHRKRRGVVEFLSVKNGLTRFQAKLRVL